MEKNNLISGAQSPLEALSERRLKQLRSVALLSFGGLACLTSTSMSHAEVALLQQPVAVSTTLPPPVTERPHEIISTKTRYPNAITAFSSQIEQAASKFQVAPCLLGVIALRESGGNIYANSGGTYGLMQLDPVTAQHTSIEHGIQYTNNIYDPGFQFAISGAIISDAEKTTAIDTNISMSANQVAEISIYYHGIGYYAQHQQGKPLPSHVIDAAQRLQTNYDQYCR